MIKLHYYNPSHINSQHKEELEKAKDESEHEVEATLKANKLWNIWISEGEPQYASVTLNSKREAICMSH